MTVPNFISGRPVPISRWLTFQVILGVLQHLGGGGGLVSAQTGYTSLGCWNDVSTRTALRNNEGRGLSSLDGTASTRTDAINKCYTVAVQQGENVFAIQKGTCFSMADAVPGGDYARYGPASTCPADGRGTTLVNHVYQVVGAPNYAPDYNTLPYTSLGCWNDQKFMGNGLNRALPNNEPGFTGSRFLNIFISSDFRSRPDAVNKCYQVAALQGHNVFALSEGGSCFSQLDVVPGGSYSRYGNSSSCRADGRGETMVMNVYQIKGAPGAVVDYDNLPYNSLGCWFDQKHLGNGALRALRNNEPGFTGTRYTHILLSGDFLARPDAVNRCYQVAALQGHNLFALSEGGACFSQLDVVPGGSYSRYGNSSFCRTDGRGASMIIHAYQIKGAPGAVVNYDNLPYNSLGCWNDQKYLGNGANRALPNNEPGFTGTRYTHILLSGDFLARPDAVNRCYQVAALQGHNVFALSEGGACFSELDVVPGGTYSRYGNNSFCRIDGRGEAMIIHAYQIKGAPGAIANYDNLPYNSLGCWNDQKYLGNGANRALPNNEPGFTGSKYTHILLSGDFLSRPDAVNRCYQVAALQGHNVFALSEGGACFSQLDIVPGGSYSRYGNSSFCRTDGRGANLIIHAYQIKDAPGAVVNYDNLPYDSLGCWLDQKFMANGLNRVLPNNEPGFTGSQYLNILLSDDFLARPDAVNRCYQVAALQGHNVFALSEGGACFSQLDIVPGGSYTRYGNSSFCRTDGRGANAIIHAYQIKGAPGPSFDYTNLPYTSLGCWLDLGSGANRALRSNEGTYIGILDGIASGRADAINKCYQVAQLRGHNVFGVQNGACYSQLDVSQGGSYTQFGRSSFCPTNGRGAFNVNHVYEIKNSTGVSFDWVNLPYSSLGCYFDGTPQLLRNNEGLFATLDAVGNVANRTNAISKCYQVALSQNHNIFALQFNGVCYSSSDVYPGGDYAKYGVTTFCPLDGKGGLNVNHVYRVNNITSKVLTFADLPYPSGLPFFSLGCWADSATTKALILQEGTDTILDGSFSTRNNAVHKCYMVALKRGHNVFGVQNGGQCYSKFDTVPGGTYAQYGRSSACPLNGKGATNVNNVYRVVA